LSVEHHRLSLNHHCGGATSRYLGLHEAREALEHLFWVTELVSPQHPAPPGWITSLHAALERPDLDGRLDHYRLDDHFGVNMAFLHHRVGQALLAFDDLAMGSVSNTSAD
jgi:hypothetical protein